MTLEELHGILSRRPFVPVRLHLGSMHAVDVISPECVSNGSMPRLLQIAQSDGMTATVDVLSIERVDLLLGGKQGSHTRDAASVTDANGKAFTLRTHRRMLGGGRFAQVPRLVDQTEQQVFTLTDTLWNLERVIVAGGVIEMHLLNGYNFVRTPKLVWSAAMPDQLDLDNAGPRPLAEVVALLLNEDRNIRIAATGVEPRGHSPFDPPEDDEYADHLK